MILLSRYQTFQLGLPVWLSHTSPNKVVGADMQEGNLCQVFWGLQR